MHTFTTEDVAINIEALIKFIGVERIEKSIAAWRNAIVNSFPLVRVHQQQESFYWWPGFANYRDGRGDGMPYSIETLLLAKDAGKVLDVLETMPESIKGKYAGALGDIRNSQAHLFEISMAHHFMSLGHSIRWIENSGQGIAEFIVVTATIEFEVECKHISVNAGRLVTRDEFSRFSALILALLRKRRLMGKVLVELDARLPKASDDVEHILSTISAAIDVGSADGLIDVQPWGRVAVELSAANDVPINWDTTEAQMRATKPADGHAVVHAERLNNQPVNLIHLTLQTVEHSEYLKAIYATMKDAAKRQLSKCRPGLLCIHIPEIGDFSSLMEESGLRNMTAYFFDSKDRDHVCAVAYSSDTRIIVEPTGYQFTTDALAYKNSFCRFMEARDMRLFNHEAAPPTLQPTDLKAMQAFDNDEVQGGEKYG